MKTKSWGKLETLTPTDVRDWKSGDGAFVYVGKKRFVWTKEAGEKPAVGITQRYETRYAWCFRSWAIRAGEKE